MKKSLLALGAVAALGGLGFSGAANAVWVVGDVADAAATQLSPVDSGVGHILVTPYFSTVAKDNNGANTTLLSIVNTDTKNGKAVKVRFRGAANSDDVFDFTVLLSPYDVWTATVSRGADGLSRISTPDNSCVLPTKMPADGIEFNPLRLPSTLSEDAKAAHTQEGYVEWLNMADIPPSTPLYAQIKHDKNGMPKCDQAEMDYLTAASDANVAATRFGGRAALTTDEASAYGLVQPTGGLMGNWSIFNNTNVTSYGGPHSAIAAMDSMGDQRAAARLFFAPQIGDNDLYFPTGGAGQPAIWADGSTAGGGNLSETADPLLTNAVNGGQTPVRLAMLPFDLPDLSTPYVNATPVAGINPAPLQASVLSDALAAKALMNEWTAASDNGVDFATDWVFSQPTRRYHVVMDYVAAAAGGSAASGVVHNTQTQHLFYLPGGMEGQRQLTYGDMVCLKAGVTDSAIYNREEGTAAIQYAGGQWSPGRPAAPGRGFCGEVAVMQFGAAPVRALNGQLTLETVTPPTGFGAGWMSYGFKTTVAPRGLPVVGYAANTFKGVSAQGAGNYGDAITHRYVRAAKTAITGPTLP